jgi:hypothetical protein
MGRVKGEREREWWAKALDPVLKRGEGYWSMLWGFFFLFFLGAWSFIEGLGGAGRPAEQGGPT